MYAKDRSNNEKPTLKYCLQQVGPYEWRAGLQPLTTDELAAMRTLADDGAELPSSPLYQR